MAIQTYHPRSMILRALADKAKALREQLSHRSKTQNMIFDQLEPSIEKMTPAERQRLQLDEHPEAKRLQRNQADLPARNKKPDPNKSVRNASNTVSIEGHPCAKVCQKLGFANCRCKENENIQDLLVAITFFIKQLQPVHWKLFGKKPVWISHPHHHHYRLEMANQDSADVVAETDPMDLILYDDDFPHDFELTDDPFMIIIRALVPFTDLKPQFETFLKDLAMKMPDIQNHQELVERGYSLTHQPETGITVLRMPDPKHQLMFMQHLAQKGFIGLTPQAIPDLFARMMQARYDTLAPTPKPGGRSRSEFDELQQARSPYRTPTPFDTRLSLTTK